MFVRIEQNIDALVCAHIAHALKRKPSPPRPSNGRRSNDSLRATNLRLARRWICVPAGRMLPFGKPHSSLAERGAGGLPPHRGTKPIAAIKRRVFIVSHINLERQLPGASGSIQVTPQSSEVLIVVRCKQVLARSCLETSHPSGRGSRESVPASERPVLLTGGFARKERIAIDAAGQKSGGDSARLKNSPRNWMYRRRFSMGRNRAARTRSKSGRHGFRAQSSVRAELPSRPYAGRANAEGLK